MSDLLEYLSRKEITVLDMIIVSVISVLISNVIGRISGYINSLYKKQKKHIEYKRSLKDENAFVPMSVYRNLKETNRKLKKYEIDFLERTDKESEKQRLNFMTNNSGMKEQQEKIERAIKAMEDHYSK